MAAAEEETEAQEELGLGLNLSLCLSPFSLCTLPSILIPPLLALSPPLPLPLPFFLHLPSPPSLFVLTLSLLPVDI